MTVPVLLGTSTSGRCGETGAAIVAILVTTSDAPLTAAFGHAGTALNHLAQLAVLGLSPWAFALRLSLVPVDARAS